MSYQEVLGQQVIAISTSESPDMPALGLTEGHLRDAMVEIARHLLALGARLAYGGDLRQFGFSELLFELVARHRRDADEGDNRTSITNYLAWPVHIQQSAEKLETATAYLEGSVELICLRLDGTRMSITNRELAPLLPTEAEWSDGLTAMRRTMLNGTNARILLGGRVDEYKGIMPGIAEEALLSLQAGQPLYLIGGFGGCARDIAETLGLISPWPMSQDRWSSRTVFKPFSAADLKNGLTIDENTTLANTSHVDQAVTLILRGLIRLLRARLDI